MTQDGDQLQFDVRLNLESFIAGIDMTDVSDTALSAEASTYDALRAMEPAALEARFQTFWPQMAESMTITADGVAITPELIGVAVGPLGDIEVTRASEISFTAALPAGSKEVQVGWAKEFGVLVLRQMGVEAPYDGYLEAGALSDPIVLAGGGQATGWETFVSYIPVGFDHIVPKGLDHILFVLGLFFYAARWRPLLGQVTLFTLAHTTTLVLASTGHIVVSPNLVEPLIAASIIYVAFENLRSERLHAGRLLVIFAFGLLHGLGGISRAHIVYNRGRRLCGHF